MTGSDFDEQIGQFGDELRGATVRAETRRRRTLRAAGVLGAACCAGLGAVVLVPGAARLDPVAEARAALGADGGILHYRVTFQSQLPGSKSAPPSPPQEAWVGTDREPRWRMVRTREPACGILDVPFGRDLVSYVAPTEQSYADRTLRDYSPWSELIVEFPRDRGRGLQLPMAPLVALPKELGDDRDPAGALRRALGRGLLRDAGTAQAGGRSLRLLTGEVGKRETAPERTVSVNQKTGKRKRMYPGEMVERRPTQLRYTVDATTFAPVELQTRTYVLWSRAGGRQRYRWHTSTIRFLEFERLEATPANRALLGLQAPPGTEVVRVPPRPTNGTGLPPKVSRPDPASRRKAEADARRCREASR